MQHLMPGEVTLLSQLTAILQARQLWAAQQWVVLADPLAEDKQVKVQDEPLDYLNASSIAGWVEAVQSIPPQAVIVATVGWMTQVLCRVADGCYALIGEDGFDDTSWALPVLAADSGSDCSAWNFRCWSFGDVLVTYFFLS